MQFLQIRGGSLFQKRVTGSGKLSVPQPVGHLLRQLGGLAKRQRYQLPAHRSLVVRAQSSLVGAAGAVDRAAVEPIEGLLLHFLGHSHGFFQIGLVELATERGIDLGHDGRGVARLGGDVSVVFGLGQIAHKAQDGDPYGQSGQLISVALKRQQGILERAAEESGGSVTLEISGGELGEFILRNVVGGILFRRDWWQGDFGLVRRLLGGDGLRKKSRGRKQNDSGG